MIERIYDHATAALFATGPSLSAEQVELVRGHADIVRIGCNDAYRLVPDLDILYAPDPTWIDYHSAELEGYSARRLSCKQDGPRQFPDWEQLEWRDQPGLSPAHDYIHTGSHSGAAMIDIARKLGCNYLILLGYDGGPAGTHFFGPHPRPLHRSTHYDQYNQKFLPITADCTRLGIEVINATPGSRIKAFPSASLEEALDYHCLRRNRPVADAAAG